MTTTDDLMHDHHACNDDSCLICYNEHDCPEPRRVWAAERSLCRYLHPPDLDGSLFQW